LDRWSDADGPWFLQPRKIKIQKTEFIKSVEHHIIISTMKITFIFFVLLATFGSTIGEQEMAGSAMPSAPLDASASTASNNQFFLQKWNAHSIAMKLDAVV
jgi:hypothetical protein